MKYQSAAALLLAISAAGCADLRWHKDGEDTTTLSRDTEECQQLGRARAAQEAWPLGVATPRVVGVDAVGRAIVSSPGQVDTNRFFIEHDVARFCMRSKGYELVPVKDQ
ncbi:MAG TPA: hypothetical protein VMS53_10260 [Burkholderiales bacterium]|nr:hypothetical protein [Burkholderiales bacterium]